MVRKGQRFMFLLRIMIVNDVLLEQMAKEKKEYDLMVD